MNHELCDEQFLSLLRKVHADEFETRRDGGLGGVVGETKITGQTQVEVLDREGKQPSVVESLKFQGMDRFAGMACFSESLDEFPGQVFVDENSQATMG